MEDLLHRSIASQISLLRVQTAAMDTRTREVEGDPIPWTDDLLASVRELQWVMNAFFMMFAMFMVTMGRLGDIYGGQRTATVSTRSRQEKRRRVPKALTQKAWDDLGECA